jgi:hypothetical protein
MRMLELMLNPNVILMYLAIILFNALSVYYTIRWIIEIRKRFTPLVISVKVFHGITSLALGLSYVYSLIKILTGDPIEITIYGVTVIRPLILMVSLYMAVSAKIRHYLGKHREDLCQKV